MHELPRTGLVSKDARGAERDRRHVLAASHPRPQALDLDQEREICRHLFRYEIEPDGLPVPIERGGMLCTTCSNPRTKGPNGFPRVTSSCLDQSFAKGS